MVDKLLSVYRKLQDLSQCLDQDVNGEEFRIVRHYMNLSLQILKYHLHSAGGKGEKNRFHFCGVTKNSSKLLKSRSSTGVVPTPEGFVTPNQNTSLSPVNNFVNNPVNNVVNNVNIEPHCLDIGFTDWERASSEVYQRTLNADKMHFVSAEKAQLKSMVFKVAEKLQTIEGSESVKFYYVNATAWLTDGKVYVSHTATG